jgi:hypothetical protein
MPVHFGHQGKKAAFAAVAGFLVVLASYCVYVIIDYYILRLARAAVN